MKCPIETFLPTRWICRPATRPDRPAFAAHLRFLRREYGRTTARRCIHEMAWIGIYPVTLRRWMDR